MFPSSRRGEFLVLFEKRRSERVEQPLVSDEHRDLFRERGVTLFETHALQGFVLSE
jgi:hypothetical protein